MTYPKYLCIHCNFKQSTAKTLCYHCQTWGCERCLKRIVSTEDIVKVAGLHFCCANGMRSASNIEPRTGRAEYSLICACDTKSCLKC